MPIPLPIEDNIGVIVEDVLVLWTWQRRLLLVVLFTTTP